MAYTGTITRRVVNKDACIEPFSPTIELFSALIGKLAVAIAAERALAAGDDAESARDRLIVESEVAWDGVTDIHLALVQEPVVRAEDMPLRMLAALIDRRRGVETADELQGLRSVMQRESAWHISRGDGAGSSRITSMLGQGRYLLDVIDTLDVFQPLADRPDAPDRSFEA